MAGRTLAQLTFLARRLWDVARADAAWRTPGGGFTVNASLPAVPVYERFGFEKQGDVQVARGVMFQPMRLAQA